MFQQIFSDDCDEVKSAIQKLWDLVAQGLISGLGRSPGGGHGNPLQYSCLENPHRYRSLMDCSPWGCKESDMTEQLSTAWHSTAQYRFESLQVQSR